MTILGLNAYHADSAACLLIDGKLVAAAEEERLPADQALGWSAYPSHRLLPARRRANDS